MKSRFQFGTLDIVMLIINTIVFGGCVVLLLLGRASGPLVLLTIGSFGLLIRKLGRAHYRARRSESPLPAGQG